MRTDGFKGILLSILMTVSLIAPAITAISLLSVSPVSANPGSGNYENIVLGGATAYTINGDATPPWKPYAVGDYPVIMAANTVDSGAVVAAGLAATCRNGRWNGMANSYPNLDVLLDNAFQWMVPGATKVLWYGEDTIDYNVYNDATGCSALITALTNLGYTVTDTVDEAFTDLTAGLLATHDPDILVIPQMELGDAGTGGDPDQLPQSVVDVIESFVRGGGGLLIMEGYDTFGYNYAWVQDKILKALDMGMYFQSDTIQDDTNNWGAAAWQPYVDVNNTTWIGSAYENATGSTTIGVYGASSLAERDNYEVSAGISPEYQNAFPNTTITYTVSVIAAGWNIDNINLAVSDNEWETTLGATTLTDVGLAGKETTLAVEIPSGTLGTEDEMTVTATSQGDGAKSQAVKVKAISSMQIGPPVADTYVTQWAQEADSYTGTYIWMQVGSDKDNNKRTYLKFDLSAIPEGLIPPDNVQIDDLRARVYLYCEVLPTYAAAGKDVSIYEVNDDAWAENNMLWGDNEPGIGNLLDTTQVTEEDYWYSWDVTQHVIDEFRNDNIASFSLRAPTEDLEGTDAYEYYSFATSNATETWQHPYLIIGYDVSTWISPDYDGLPGGTLTYNVNVWNRGSEDDNFDLTIDENVWETTLSPSRIEDVQPMETRTAELTVKIPAGASIGNSDNILITAVSEHSGESDNGVCVARAWTNVSVWEDSSTRGSDDPRSHLENSVWGRSTGIYVGRYSDAPERGWLKFDLRAFPAGTTVTRANLYLNSYSTYSADVRVYGVGDDSWSEYTIKWTDKPSIDTDNALDTRAVIENDKWYSWDVTDFVASEYAGDKIVRFCLVDIGENVAPNHDARFSSKEWGDNVPYLEILAAAPNTGVSAYAKPIFQGGVGTTLTYTITVVNKGDSLDSFDLFLEETEAWGSYLSDTTLSNIASGDNGTTTLNVPVGGSICTTNEITISVISQENPAIYDNIRCSAHRSKADFVNKDGSPNKIRTKWEVWLDLNVLLSDDASELVLKFYTWGGGSQGENVVSTTMPASLQTRWKNPSPQSKAVEKVELVLEDAQGTEIQTITTFTVTKWILEIRFTEIPLEWALASPEEKDDLEEEFMNIPLYWALAP